MYAWNKKSDMAYTFPLIICNHYFHHEIFFFIRRPPQHNHQCPLIHLQQSAFCLRQSRRGEGENNKQHTKIISIIMKRRTAANKKKIDQNERKSRVSHWLKQEKKKNFRYNFIYIEAICRCCERWNMKHAANIHTCVSSSVWRN